MLAEGRYSSRCLFMCHTVCRASTGDGCCFFLSHGTSQNAAKNNKNKNKKSLSRPFLRSWILTPFHPLTCASPGSRPWLRVMRVPARSRFSRPCCSLALMSRSCRLRLLAARLASLASVEDTVAHGIHSLLVPLPGLTVADHVQPSPRPGSRAPLCSSAHRIGVGRFSSVRAALPPARQSSVAPQSPPEHICLSHIRSGSPVPAPAPQEAAGSASTVLASSLPTPRGVPASLHAPVAQSARQIPSDAAEARRRSRDKRRRRTRKQAKRSMRREI